MPTWLRPRLSGARGGVKPSAVWAAPVWPPGGRLSPAWIPPRAAFRAEPRALTRCSCSGARPSAPSRAGRGFRRRRGRRRFALQAPRFRRCFSSTFGRRSGGGGALAAPSLFWSAPGDPRAPLSTAGLTTRAKARLGQAPPFPGSAAQRSPRLGVSPVRTVRWSRPPPFLPPGPWEPQSPSAPAPNSCGRQCHSSPPFQLLVWHFSGGNKAVELLRGSASKQPFAPPPASPEAASTRSWRQSRT